MISLIDEQHSNQGISIMISSDENGPLALGQKDFFRYGLRTT